MEAYTIGQRRGLEVAYGSRIYVVDKEPGGNVRLGPMKPSTAATWRWSR